MRAPQIRLGLLAACAGLAVTALQAQAAITWDGGGSDAEWSTAGNWSGGYVPGDTAIDIAHLFQNSDDAVVTQDFASTNLFDLRMRNGASVTIGANFGQARRVTIGYFASTGCGITQTDGLVFVRDQLILGYVSAGTYDAKYSISGGILRMTTATDTGLLIDQHGVFEVIGSSATINLNAAATDVSIVNGGTLAFELAAFDVSSVDVGGTFSIGTGSLLTINAFGYTGGAGTITLANFASKSGSFDEANILITGLKEGLSANITYDATSMYLNLVGESGGPKGRTRVFLLGGQSNMNGLASVTNLPAPYDAVQGDVAFWKNGSWVALAPGYGTRSEYFGPEVSFGYTLKQALPIDRIYLVKYAANGTALYDDWAPGTGPQYTAFMSTANAALANLDAKGVDYEISGMLWLQGESDAQENQGAAYETNLRNFIADMRTRFNDPDLPFYMGRVREFYGTALQSGLVRDAQVVVAESTAHVEWFDTDSYNPLILGGHYNADGEINIGIDYANLYLASGPSGTFTGWANEQGLDGSPGKESGFNDDPDQDGVANAMEWISGGNALTAGQEVQTLVPMPASNSLFSFAFNREEDSVGRVELAVEWDTELTSAWSNSFEIIETLSGSYSKTNGIVVTVDDAPDPDRVTVSVPESFSEEDQAFFRLRASQP